MEPAYGQRARIITDILGAGLAGILGAQISALGAIFKCFSRPLCHDWHYRRLRRGEFSDR
jgi:hypothetical protein